MLGAAPQEGLTLEPAGVERLAADLAAAVGTVLETAQGGVEVLEVRFGPVERRQVRNEIHLGNRLVGHRPTVATVGWPPTTLTPVPGR